MSKETQKKETNEQWGNVKRIAGHCVAGVMNKGNRPCIVDITDKSHTPYFYTKIEGEDYFQLVHKDRYKLNKRTGKIGSLPMSSLRIK